MSEMEKELVDKLGQLPGELRQRFADTINGAVMALDAKKEEEKKPT